MSALPSDLIVMKDSPTYMPILRSVLKSQIQFLVEQLSKAGEETLILSANIDDELVDQLGSESGKMFADVYDDFKTEFLAFCQKRRGKRKSESPLKSSVDAKRGRPTPAVLPLPKSSVGTPKAQAMKLPSNVPKVSSARILVSQKPATDVGGSQIIQMSSAQADMSELEETEEGYSDIEDAGLGYEELEDWQGEESYESEDTPSSSQGPSMSSKTKTITVIPKENTSQKKALKEFKDRIEERARKTEDKNSPVNFAKMFSKAYSCKECGKLFIRGDALELHMLSHTGENPFTCKICGLGYRKKRSYIIHLKNKHPEDYAEMDEI